MYTWTTLCGSLASDVRLGGRGWGGYFSSKHFGGLGGDVRERAGYSDRDRA